MGNNKSYESIKEFLLTKDGHLRSIFRPKPDWTMGEKKWEKEAFKTY